MKLIILLILSYLAGSVNFSILLFMFLGRGDPRKSHSGNAGVTNVYRIAGPAWAALILILDVGRAVIVGLLAGYALSPGQVPWAGLALVIGNSYPCFRVSGAARAWPIIWALPPPSPRPVPWCRPWHGCWSTW